MTDWTLLKSGEKIDAIKSVWLEGSSAAQIADAVSARLTSEVSRNAIIGMYSRYGAALAGYPLRTPYKKGKGKRHNPGSWKTGKNAGRRTSMFGRALKDKHRTPSMPPEEIMQPEPIEPQSEPAFDAPPSLDIPILDVRPRQCKFIAGDPMQGAGCCGHETPEGSSWCPYHYRLVFGPGTASEREAVRYLRRAA